MHTHDGYAPHSHEIRPDHLGVPQVADAPAYAAYMAKQAHPINAGGPACGHPPFCACPTPAISPERLERLATQWEAEQAAKPGTVGPGAQLDDLVWCADHQSNVPIWGLEVHPGGCVAAELLCGCLAGCPNMLCKNHPGSCHAVGENSYVQYTGHAGGNCYGWELACGCWNMDESNDVAAAI